MSSSVDLRRGEAVGFGGKLNLSPRQLRKWIPSRNQAGATFGFLSVEPSSGLIINNRRLTVGPKGSRWMPARQQIDRDGRPRLGGNRKPIWSGFIEFRDNATRGRFQDQVLELTRTERPEAFRSGEQ